MTVYTPDERAIIALTSIDGLEYRHESSLLNLVSAPSKLFDRGEAVKAYLVKAIGENKAKTVLMALTDQYVDGVIERLDKKGVTVVTLLSKDYPHRLKNIDTPPLALYAQGDISLLNSERTLGAVGSRKSMAYAEKLTQEVCESLSKCGVTIVTGSAMGADKSAILGGLSGGRVISVIAGGIDHVYPDCNRSVIERVAKTGLVLSEHPPHTPSTFWMFPVRNRIIAALSDAVLIASGGEKSGARHTAEFAANYGKDVYAFPYSVGVKSGELCNDLIKHGAYLCDRADDLLSAFGVELPSMADDLSDLSNEERELLTAIREGEDDVTLYCAKTGKRFFEIAPVLSSLEIMGLIVKTAGNKYKPVK